MNTNRNETPISRSRDRQPAETVRSGPMVRDRRAQGRRGESLGSPRDRARLRQRNSAERSRVEGMLASAPLPLDRRTQARVEPMPAPSTPTSTSANRLRALPSTAGCPVCGDARVVTDEVMHEGTLRVSECLHCDHRWTHRPRARWIDLGARMNHNGRRPALHRVG